VGLRSDAEQMRDACMGCGECVDICPKLKTAAIMDMKSESMLAAKPNMLLPLAHRACDVDRANLATLISPAPLP
jgi:ferredoxin